MVEESLRHDPPIHVLMRDCIAATTVDDVTIPAGAKVGFGLASANRDPATYVDPDEFRLDRPSPKDHLAFGGGPHVCPGPRWPDSKAASRSRSSSTASVGEGRRRVPARTGSGVLGQRPARLPVVTS